MLHTRAMFKGEAETLELLQPAAKDVLGILKVYQPLQRSVVGSEQEGNTRAQNVVFKGRSAPYHRKELPVRRAVVALRDIQLLTGVGEYSLDAILFLGQHGPEAVCTCISVQHESPLHSRVTKYRRMGQKLLDTHQSIPIGLASQSAD